MVISFVVHSEYQKVYQMYIKACFHDFCHINFTARHDHSCYLPKYNLSSKTGKADERKAFS